MKTKILTVVAMALVVGLAAPLARAGDDVKKAERPGKSEFAPGQKKGMRGDRLKMMSEHLNLTDEQKAKLQPILAEEAKAMKVLQEDASADRQERRAKARELHESYRAQIHAVLTPEQQQKLDTMKEQNRRDRPGRPDRE